MKEDFFKFQLSKDKMNALKGGTVYACSCKKINEIQVIVANTAKELKEKAEQKCGDNNAECVPAF
ncbi:hypothetical protein [uncultured Bacteroides sp.]|uniref:hypothetical protein n=1 Tax=uncultured Bacteroides sp. TaxID=162156 RepID=UPI0025840AE2|nr:hypothetical protein [uncultured Bacteroides sp.]